MAEKDKQYYIDRIIEFGSNNKFFIEDFMPSIFDFKSMRTRLTQDRITVFDNTNNFPKTIEFSLTKDEYENIFNKITTI